MNTTTLEALCKKALSYADLVGSKFPDPDQLSGYVNDGLAELHDFIVNNHGEEYFREQEVYTLSSSTEAYELPASFYKAIAVWFVSGNRRFAIRKWNIAEVDGHRTTPITAGTVHLWYVPEFRRLLGDKDKVHTVIPSGWEDYAARHAAIQLLLNEESDPSGQMSERERLKGRIMALLSPRDAGEPDSIGDVSGRWSDGLSALIVEPALRYRIQGSNIYFVENELAGV